MCAMKQNHKFWDYKNYLETNQHGKEINYLEKSKFVVNSLRKNHKDFMKNNRLMLKSKQRVWSKKSKEFTEDIKKIALSISDEKRI